MRSWMSKSIVIINNLGEALTNSGRVPDVAVSVAARQGRTGSEEFNQDLVRLKGKVYI